MKLSVRKKLYAGFSSILALMIVLVAFVWIEVTSSHRVADEIRMDDVPELVNYLVLVDETADVYRDAMGAVTHVNGALNDYRGNKGQFFEAVDKVKALESVGTPDYRRIERVENLMKEFNTAFENRIAPKVNQEAAFLDNIRDLRALYEQYLVPIEALLDEASMAEEVQTDKALLTLSDSFTAMERMILILTAISIAAGAVIAYLLSNSITSRLTKVEQVARKVASGDLTAEDIVDDSDDELAHLGSQSTRCKSHLLA